MRSSRLLSILILLQLRVRLTAEALAREFEVSVRTVYRDIDALGAAGIPVRAERGPGGGFRLIDGYRTRLTGLAADEAEALLMIGLPGPAAALGLGASAQRARGKLLAALPAAGSDGARRIESRFHLDPVDWYRRAETVAHLPALARAVLDQRVVAMTYASWSSTRDWRVEPLGLVLKAGAWYMVARGAGKVRIFKIANILAQTVRETAFERPADFDLAACWSTALDGFEARLRPAIAVLRASRTGLERLSMWGAYAANAVADAEAADADGWSRLRLPIEHVEQAALALLGVGAEIEILAPDALRERVRALASEVARLAGRRSGGKRSKHPNAGSRRARRDARHEDG